MSSNVPTDSQKNLVWAASPTRELVRLAGPLVVSLLSTSVASLVDTLFVGRLGAVPLAAVGLGGVISFTILSFGIAVFSAAKVKVGELFGRGDADRVARSLRLFLYLAVPLGLVSFIVGQLCAAWLLPLMSSDAEAGQLSSSYTMVRAFSFPVVLIIAAISSWLSAQGKPHAPMRAAVWGNALHIPLNAFFLFGLKGGVTGLACATVLSQMIELTLLLRDCSFHKQALWKKVGAAIQVREVYRVFQVGLSTGLERVFDMMAFAAVPILLAQVSPVEVAAHQITLQLSLLSFLPMYAVAESASILISHARGAGQVHLLVRLTRSSLQAALVYAVCIAGVFAGGRHLIVSVFTNDREVASVCEKTLLFAALLQFVNAFYNIHKGLLRGLSEFRLVAVVTTGVAWLITPPLTYLIGVRAGYGAPGAWTVLCLEVTLGLGILVFCFRRHPLFKIAKIAAASRVSLAPSRVEEEPSL